MKRCFLLVLVLVLFSTCAWAQSMSDFPSGMFELSGEDTVLTVRLPSNPTTGYDWAFGISNPDIFEPIAYEYAQDEVAEGVVGAGGTWVGSFRSALASEGEGGLVTLSLAYSRPFDPEGTEPAERYDIDVWVIENGQLQVTDIRQSSADTIAE